MTNASCQIQAYPCEQVLAVTTTVEENSSQRRRFNYFDEEWTLIFVFSIDYKIKFDGFFYFVLFIFKFNFSYPSQEISIKGYLFFDSAQNDAVVTTVHQKVKRTSYILDFSPGRLNVSPSIVVLIANDSVSALTSSNVKKQSQSKVSEK